MTIDNRSGSSKHSTSKRPCTKNMLSQQLSFFSDLELYLYLGIWGFGDNIL